MNTMHSISIHIIWKTAAAANTGYDHDIFFRDAQRGHDLLYLGQDGIITTSRAPADLLIGSEIFGSERRLLYRFYRHISLISGQSYSINDVLASLEAVHCYRKE